VSGHAVTGTTWIVCANASRARVFEIVPHSGAPREVEDLANPVARAHERDLRSDAAGRFRGRGEGNAGFPYESIGEHETERFAESLREYLDHARNEQRFSQLWLVASPAFLGRLRRNFGKALQARVELEVAKDFSRDAPADMLRHVLAEREAQGRKGAGD
jgi:protein required for attachment to host cells